MAKKVPTKSVAKPKRKTPAKKKRGSKKQKRGPLKILFGYLVKGVAVGVLLLALFFIVVYLGFTGPVPSKGQLQEITNPVASEVFSEDGKVLGRYYIQNRSNVSFGEISPNVIHALVATEDARFYEHKGIDEIALFRVLVKSILLQNRSAGGGSTLSQQIAKNLYPRKNFSIFTMPVNKLRKPSLLTGLKRFIQRMRYSLST